MTTASEVASPKMLAPPGMGKWNRKNRKVVKHLKSRITKEQRREKYTAIAKDRQIRKKSKNLVCYNCRETGHAVQHCPQPATAGESTKKKQTSSNLAVICYKCGSTKHALASCPKKRSSTDTDLPFASCFVCHAKGHLASSCPNNSHGIYVNGGACTHCGSNQHRGTDCPDKKKKKMKDDGDDGGRLEEQDFNDLLEEVEKTPKREAKTKQITDKEKARKKKRVVNF
jgi:zinc finger CCHC domain-containing protein 9